MWWLQISDSVLSNYDDTSLSAETDDASNTVEHSTRHQTLQALTESLALPVLERHGETSMSSLDNDSEAGLTLRGQVAAGSSLTPVDGKDCSSVNQVDSQSLDDGEEEEREMPQLTLYAT